MNKTSEQLQKLVSPRYKQVIPKGSGRVSGFIFDDEEVVLSSVVRKALKKVNQNNEVKNLAIGYNFTFESIQLLHENNFDVVSLRELNHFAKNLSHLRSLQKRRYLQFV